jgi:hypothetical protein
VRQTASKKMEIIRPAEGTELPVRAMLRQLDVTFHRREAVLRIRIERLPDLEGRRSDHQPGLHPDVGLRCIQRSNETDFTDHPGPCTNARLGRKMGHRA